MRSLMYSLMATLLTLITAGCGIGYNTLVFATKTNMGVDIDSTPLAVEVSIARHEGVIEPTFENGKTLPVLASYNSDLNFLQRLFVGSSSAFAVGAAADVMARCYTQSAECPTDVTKDGTLMLSRVPSKRKDWFGLTEGEVDYYKPGWVSPVFFGTHSTFGLKVEWNGTTGQYPSGLKLGYHRKELAWAPVTMARVNATGTCDPSSDQPSATDSRVCMMAPSLLATLDSNSETAGFTDTKLSYLQYFATGTAATKLAEHAPVRQVMLKQILGETKPDDLAGAARQNSTLSYALAKKVSDLDARQADGLQKLKNVYAVALDKKYIDPIQVSGSAVTDSNTITATDEPAIDAEFAKQATRSRNSSADTEKLQALLYIVDKK